jgi:nucleoside triphosphatase
MAEQQYPEPTVGGLVVSPEGKVLLVKSHKWRGKYVMPGGHIELGESIREALHREIKEETGLEVHECQFLCFQEFIMDDSFWKERHFIFFDFACKTRSTEVVLNDEAQAYEWVTVEEALEKPMDDYMRRAIEVYADKKDDLVFGEGTEPHSCS